MLVKRGWAQIGCNQLVAEGSAKFQARVEGSRGDLGKLFHYTPASLKEGNGSEEEAESGRWQGRAVMAVDGGS